MGHVDHGKTSLLDAIREENVVSSESGGITQHIGAYQIEYEGKKITFLDTPGHEAFSTMRARGAQVTDVGILVVAADDGVKPQTIESIHHLKSADIPFIVAVNKIDKPEADLERVKKELAEEKVMPEEWGGSTVFVPVSAKTKEVIDELLEMVLLVSEIKEPRANPDGQFLGTTIETHLDKTKGPTATIVVQNGTLKIGDFVFCGSSYGKIKAMEDSSLKKVTEVYPSMPVRILGLKSVPDIGEFIEKVSSEHEARAEAAEVKKFENLKKIQDKKTSGVKGISEKIKESRKKELKIIIKADVRGSLEALSLALKKISGEEVSVNIIRENVGEILESDIRLAGQDTIIFGFRVGMSIPAQKAAEKMGTEVRLYDIIYDVVDDVKKALVGLLPKEIIEIEAGRARILKIFKQGKNDIIVGAKLLRGEVKKEMEVRVGTKDSEERGFISSLRIVKDEVSEVLGAKEFGINIKNITNLKEDDELVFIKKEEKVKKI